MVSLKDFVSATITDIIDGVVEARRTAAGKGAVVNAGAGPLFPNVEPIQFDVAVTTEEGTQTGSDAGVRVSILNLGTRGSSENSITNATRVKFQVVVKFPTDMK